MASFNISAQSSFFKTKYGPLAMNTYNSANVMLARAKKDYDFTGDQLFISQPTSFSGGVGAGLLPVANAANYGKALIVAKKMYSVMQYDREAIKASSNSEGAFGKGIDEVTKKGVESFMRFMSYTLFRDGSGVLGQIASVSGSGPYDLTIITTGADRWKEANFEEKDYVDINTARLTGGTARGTFEITAIVASTRVVTVAAVGTVTAPQANDFVHMQNSRAVCPQGLQGVCDATSGTLYNLNVGRRWQSTQLNANSGPVTLDILNNQMLEVQRRCGKVPKMIVASFKQYAKIMNLMEDLKQYVIAPRDGNLKGKVSFNALEFMSASGAVPIMPERFVDDDRIYLVNDDYMTIFHRPDFGFFDDDGSVFLRDAGDTYSARYGGYLETYIVPSFQGVITGLS